MRTKSEEIKVEIIKQQLSQINIIFHLVIVLGIYYFSNSNIKFTLFFFQIIKISLKFTVFKTILIFNFQI